MWNPHLHQKKNYCVFSLVLFTLVLKISTDHLHEEKPNSLPLSLSYGVIVATPVQRFDEKWPLSFA